MLRHLISILIGFKVGFEPTTVCEDSLLLIKSLFGFEEKVWNWKKLSILRETTSVLFSHLVSQNCFKDFLEKKWKKYFANCGEKNETRAKFSVIRNLSRLSWNRNILLPRLPLKLQQHYELDLHVFLRFIILRLWHFWWLERRWRILH